MRTEKNSKVAPRKKTIRRILVVGLPLLVVLIVLLILLAPVFISSAQGRRLILAKINGSIPGKADFADLSMSWFKGIKVDDFSFHDNAGQLSVRVGRIATKPDYGALLTGNLSFGRTVIDKPRVEINLKGPRAAQAKASPQKPAGGPAVQPVVLPIRKIDLVLNDGDVKVTDPKSGTVELSRINSKLNLQPPGKQTDFDLSMAVAQAGKPSEIRVAAQVTPKQRTGWSLEGTSGNLTVEVNDLDVGSLGPFLAMAGVDVQAKGVVRGQIKGQIKDGRVETASADVSAKNLDVTGAALKGDRLHTSDLQVNAAVSQGQGTINIRTLKIKSDWASASASGTLPTTLKSFADLLQAGSKYTLNGDFNCDVAAILSQIPRTLGLKKGIQVTSGRLTGSVATTTQAGQKQMQATATLADLGGTVQEKKIAFSAPIKAEATVSSGKAGLNFDKIDVSAPFANINCAGSAQAMKYNADADLTKLQSELGQFVDFGPYQIAGAFLIKGQVSIGPDRITTFATSVFNNLHVASKDGRSFSEPKAEIDSAVDFNRKTSVVALSSVTATTSFGRLGVKDGVVPLNKNSAQPLRLTVSAGKLDLAKVRPVAALFASLPKQMQFAGIVDSRLSVSGQKNVYEIATNSTKISNFKLLYTGQKPFEANDVSIAFDTEINAETQAVNAKSFQLDSPKIKILKGQFARTTEGDKMKLEGQAVCKYDWTTVSALVAPYMPEGLTLEGQRTDAVNFLSVYPIAQPDQLLPNLTAKAQVGFQHGGYMGLDFGPTNVDIQVNKGQLKIAPFTAKVNNGQFSFAGQADFKRKPVLLKTPKPMQIVKNINVNDATTRKLLKYVNPIFANAVNVSGIANFNCEQLAVPIDAKAKNDAVVIGTISVSQLQLQASDLLGQILTIAGTGGRGTVLTMHPTRFVLQNGFLRYDNMQIDVGDNPVNFKGVIGLDKSLDMTVTLPYTSAGRTARIGRQTAGSRITLPLKGTVDAPKIDTSKLIQENLKGEIQNQLQRGLERLLK
jgi:hypothetical protein